MRNLRNPQLGRGEVCIEDIELDLKSRADIPTLLSGKACNRVPHRAGIGDQFVPASFVAETPFHQATTERPAGLICVEKIGLARRRFPPTALPSRSGSN